MSRKLLVNHPIVGSQILRNRVTIVKTPSTTEVDVLVVVLIFWGETHPASDQSIVMDWMYCSDSLGGKAVPTRFLGL